MTKINSLEELQSEQFELSEAYKKDDCYGRNDITFHSDSKALQHMSVKDHESFWLHAATSVIKAPYLLATQHHGHAKRHRELTTQQMTQIEIADFAKAGNKYCANTIFANRLCANQDRYDAQLARIAANEPTFDENALCTNEGYGEEVPFLSDRMSMLYAKVSCHKFRASARVLFVQSSDTTLAPQVIRSADQSCDISTIGPPKITMWKQRSNNLAGNMLARLIHDVQKEVPRVIENWDKKFSIHGTFCLHSCLDFTVWLVERPSSIRVWEALVVEK